LKAEARDARTCSISLSGPRGVENGSRGDELVGPNALKYAEAKALFIVPRNEYERLEREGKSI
jgi:hypothetical protein